jgi:hypothetical protein
MSLSLQNLRAVTSGVEPASLLPGQLCFNLVDKIVYIGNNSGFKTSFDGTQVTGTPDLGWYSMPMDFTSLSNYFVPNPSYWGQVPLDKQVLSWSAVDGHPVCSSSGQEVPINYITTNSLVNAAPGSDTSTKISAALGVTPVESDSVIVQGSPGDTYQGFYQFISGFWTFSAQNAFPTASQVPVDEDVFPLGSTVQLALENLSTLVTAAQATAEEALSKSGGTMTGIINFVNDQPVDAGSF